VSSRRVIYFVSGVFRTVAIEPFIIASSPLIGPLCLFPRNLFLPRFFFFLYPAQEVLPLPARAQVPSFPFRQLIVPLVKWPSCTCAREPPWSIPLLLPRPHLSRHLLMRPYFSAAESLHRFLHHRQRLRLAIYGTSMRLSQPRQASQRFFLSSLNFLPTAARRFGARYLVERCFSYLRASFFLPFFSFDPPQVNLFSRSVKKRSSLAPAQ